MERSHFLGFFAIAVAVGHLFSQTGCGNSKDAGQQAKAIYQRAESLREDGHVLEALREFSRLANFSETNVFKKAEAALLQEGISIRTPLESWTLKQMIEAQNRLIQQGKDWHRDGNITVPYSATDAWGRSLMVEYSTGSKFSFYVWSAGADRQFNTDDDLKAFNRRKASGRDKAQGVAGPLDTPAGHKKAASPPREQSTQAKRTEGVVELKDLLPNH